MPDEYTRVYLLHLLSENEKLLLLFDMNICVWDYVRGKFIYYKKCKLF